MAHLKAGESVKVVDSESEYYRERGVVVFAFSRESIIVEFSTWRTHKGVTKRVTIWIVCPDRALRLEKPR